MQGICQVVLLWNTLGETDANKIGGNTILKMYGNWLFDASLVDLPGLSYNNYRCDEGRAIALGCLCNIFSRYQKNCFLKSYLQTFYQVIIKVF
jgi:hypothetical protein